MSTRRPSAITPSTVQLFTGVPSRSTTHAPQFDVSQPQCVPVSPKSSRSRWTSSTRGSTSAERVSPLTVTVMFMTVSSPRARATAASQRPLGQLAGEVALVLGRAALVGRSGCSARRRAPPAAAIASSVTGLAAQRVLGGGGAELLGADRGEPDADLADRVAVEPDAGPGGGDRPVAGPPLDLAVRRCRRRAGSARGSR